jgi:hypothetical protein
MASEIALEIQQHLSQYLNGDIQLYEFEDWFAPILWGLADSPDEQARELAGRLYNLIAETSRGHRDVESMRWEMEVAACSLAEPVRVYAPAIEVVYGKPLAEAGTASSWLRLRLVCAVA